MARTKSSGVTPGRMVPASVLAFRSSVTAAVTGPWPRPVRVPRAVALRIASARPALAIAYWARRSIHSRRARSGARVARSWAAVSATCCTSYR